MAIILNGTKIVGEGYVMPILSNTYMTEYHGEYIISTTNTVPLTIIANNATISGNGFVIYSITGNETLYLPAGEYIVKQGVFQKSINLTSPTTFQLIPIQTT